MNAAEGLRRFMRQTIVHADRAPDEARALLQHSLHQTARISGGVAALACLLTVVWWPLDYVLYAKAPAIRDIMFDWRVGNILTMGPLALLTVFSARVRARPVLPVALFGALASGLATWSCGRVQPQDAAWFGITYAFPITTIAFVVPFFSRVFIALCFATASWCGFFLMNPAQLRAEQHLGLTISLQLVIVVTSITIGHLQYHFFRAGFLAQRALTGVNQELDRRVQAQAADLRQLASRMERLVEQERMTIARQLDIELGKTLESIRFELGLLAQRAARREHDVKHQVVDSLLDRMLGTFQRLTHTLRPQQLDEVGLVAAAEMLAQEHRRRSGLDIVLGVTPPDLIVRGNLATATYRVLQEALTNVVRHANAKRVVVDIDGFRGMLIVSVRDDGCGIAERQEWRRESVGVVGMRERARRLGGEFEIRRGAERGTVVTLRLPIEMPARELSA